MRIHVAAHLELHRDHVQLFADVLADLDQFALATGAMVVLGFVDHFLARQVGWQTTPMRLAAGCLGLLLGRLDLGKLGFQRRDVGRHRLIEQLPLRRIHAFGLRRKLHPAQARQLVVQLVDLQIANADGVVTLGDSLELLAHQAAQDFDIGDGVERGGIHACTI